MPLRLAASFAAILSIGCSPPACGNGVVEAGDWDGFSRATSDSVRCHLVSETAVTAAEAESTCAALPGAVGLSQIRRHEDWRWDLEEATHRVAAAAREAGAESVWVGVSDRADEGYYVWPDGEEAIPAFWSRGEPTGGDEDCVAMTTAMVGAREGIWFDAPCEERRRFVCTARLLGVTAP